MTPFNPNDPNVAMLERVVRRLDRDLCQALVFVGGAAAGLLITDLALPGIRRTEDVDMVSPARALDEFHQLEQRLRQAGFEPDLRPNAPICRWIVDGITVDVMPSKEEILGFANRWYPLAVATARTRELPSGLHIRVIRAPEFIATKLEAFHGRGEGDYLFSHDLGDILSVVDGRDSLVAECMESPASLREYLACEFHALLADASFLDALPGHLPPDPANQARLPRMMDVLGELAALPRT